MIKIAFLILLFSFCSSYGVLKTVSLKSREASLAAMRNSVSLLKNEICYLNSDVYTAANTVSEKDGTGMFFYLKNRLFSPAENYAYAKEKVGKKLCFSADDWAVCDGFFSSLGALCFEAQAESFEKALSDLSAHHSAAVTRTEKYSKLYSSSGFLVGLFLVIILL